MLEILVVNINISADDLAGCTQIAQVLREVGAAGGPLEVHVAHYTEAIGRARGRRNSALVLGPNGTPFPAYPSDFDTFLAWVRRLRRPVLGICGGHQALALAHGAPVGPVADVRAASASYDGMPKLRGTYTIRWLGDPDPLLAGVPEECDVVVSHVDEVKDIPSGFRLLAIGDPCHVQAIRADRRPMYGVQFHPEKACHDPAGRTLLSNFVALAR